LTLVRQRAFAKAEILSGKNVPGSLTNGAVSEILLAFMPGVG
jgi:hypothetical protein